MLDVADFQHLSFFFPCLTVSAQEFFRLLSDPKIWPVDLRKSALFEARTHISGYSLEIGLRYFFAFFKRREIRFYDIFHQLFAPFVVRDLFRGILKFSVELLFCSQFFLQNYLFSEFSSFLVDNL